MNNPKQVIVVRRYFPDGSGGQKKVRTGKMIAQAAHASMKVFFDKMNEENLSNGGDYEGVFNFNFYLDTLNTPSDKAVYEWIKGSFTKVVVYVDNEIELLNIYNKAKNSGICCSLIQDSGKTEFNGIPTYTAVAVGPDYPEKIDLITSGLKLL